MTAPAELPPSPQDLEVLEQAIARDGHVFVQGAAMRPLLEQRGALDDWEHFAASWDDLAVDMHMADGGRYRRRRHAVYVATAKGPIERRPHQPHYQSLDYNRLNGGVARWFEPLREDIAAGASLNTLLEFCRGLFGRLAPAVQSWHVEVHQFRIEARADEAGQPTPEGVHRDGVDGVLVLLIRRHNIVSGTTTIHRPDGQALGSFTLTAPFDAALIDDNRVYHGVTPVQPLDPAQPACRDVLVLTFRRAA
ncbi:MAG TPA: 2OG-Fe dioxygenase family protein [Solimonas sp.]|nr:2OG-Fe dioxygenase family protein [Solimonas sp.]